MSDWSADVCPSDLIMRAMDIMLALPSLLLAIVIVAILGPSLTNAIMAVAIVALPHYVRLSRASAISERTKEYVTASQVSGAGLLRLMFVKIGRASGRVRGCPYDLNSVGAVV